MLEVLNDAMLGMLLSVGHRTGLFDQLAQLPPSTSQQVADAAGLDERYVREWLGGMTVARIVDYDPTDATCRLPPEHASFLTRAAGPDNLAFFIQYLALIGQVEDEVVDAFRTGGGVPYSSYPTFQRLQAEETARIFDAALVDTIIPLAPGLPERLQAGIDVLDVGCGQDHAINLLAQAFRRAALLASTSPRRASPQPGPKPPIVASPTSASRSKTPRLLRGPTTWSSPTTSSTTWPAPTRS